MKQCLLVSGYMLLIVCFISSVALAQEKKDTTKMNTSRYAFRLNHKPQDGYGIVLGWLGNKKQEGEIKTTRTIYKIGIARTSHEITAEAITYYNKSISLEVNKIENNTVYGFVGGLDMKAFFFDFGLYLNYMTDFSNKRALSIRPSFAFTLMHFLNLDITVEYEIFPVKPNFDYVSHWLFGLRYTIGVIKHY